MLIASFALNKHMADKGRRWWEARKMTYAGSRSYVNELLWVFLRSFLECSPLCWLWVSCSDVFRFCLTSPVTHHRLVLTSNRINLARTSTFWTTWFLFLLVLCTRCCLGLATCCITSGSGGHGVMQWRNPVHYCMRVFKLLRAIGKLWFGWGGALALLGLDTSIYPCVRFYQKCPWWHPYLLSPTLLHQ